MPGAASAAPSAQGELFNQLQRMQDQLSRSKAPSKFCRIK
jgi:hypothetical protein